MTSKIVYLAGLGPGSILTFGLAAEPGLEPSKEAEILLAKKRMKNEPNPKNEHKRRQSASTQPLRQRSPPPTTDHHGAPPRNNEPILPSLGMNEQEVAHCNSRSGRNPLLRSPTTSSGCSRLTTVWSSARLTASRA